MRPRCFATAGQGPRRFEGLATCQRELDRHTTLPKIVFQVQDNAYIMRANVDIIMRSLDYHSEKMVVITEGCATRHGINNRFAVVSGSAAKLYFTSPILQYSRNTLAPWANNMETYYLDTYMSNQLLMQTTSEIHSLTSQLNLWTDKEGECKKFIPIGAAACERLGEDMSAISVDKRTRQMHDIHPLNPSLEGGGG